MGELVRRLEYERRSRSNALMTNKSSRGQEISKEYSTAVRSANAMADRKCDLYIQRNEVHKRLFLNRYEYERKMIQQFKSDLDFKSQEFHEDKFQLLRRAQSANSRSETFTGRKKKLRRKRKVSELVPRKYYNDDDGQSESDSADCGTSSAAAQMQHRPSIVTSGLFGLISKAKYLHHNREMASSEGEADNTVDAATTERRVSVTKSPEHEADNAFVGEAGKTENKGANVSAEDASNRQRPFAFSLGTISERPKPRAQSAMAALQSRTPEMIINVNPRALSASANRQITPPGTSVTALIPRDLKVKRRRSCSSMDTDDDVADLPPDASRSFRLLREAFQKVKLEPTDPSRERFEAIKDHHKSESKVLREKSMDRFKDIFVEDVFISLHPDE